MLSVVESSDVDSGSNGCWSHLMPLIWYIKMNLIWYCSNFQQLLVTEPAEIKSGITRYGYASVYVHKLSPFLKRSSSFVWLLCFQLVQIKFKCQIYPNVLKLYCLWRLMNTHIHSFFELTVLFITYCSVILPAYLWAYLLVIITQF